VLAGLLIVVATLWRATGANAAASGTTYVVQPGDTLGYIALKYGTTPAAIVQANGLGGPDTIFSGETLTIPVGSAAAPSSGGASATGIYTVQLGDTLASIAQAVNVTQQALADANGLTDPDVLWVGQKLVVPNPAVGGGAGPTATGASASRYVVQPGDTISAIAVSLGVAPSALAAANNLSDADSLQVGQSLVIPVQGQASVSPPGTSQTAGAGVQRSYIVQPGDTLDSIAQQYGLDVTALETANGLSDSDFLQVGQTLNLPAANGPYTVKAGDTLTSVAQELGVSEDALAQANGLSDADVLQVGQVLTMPGAGQAAAAGGANAAATSEPSGQYVVQAGDTLSGIAQALGVSAEALAQANGLSDADALQVGQVLAMPGAGQAAAASASTAGTAPVAVSSAGATPAANGQYVVQAGDTLGSIAQALGVDEDALAQANGLTDPDSLQIGQFLTVPAAGVAATGTLTSSVASANADSYTMADPAAVGTVHYTVQSGDTLGSIAAKYDTSAAVLARSNQLASPDMVSVGTDLIIPNSGWAAQGISGTPSRFVVSISLQRCWLYQGNSIVANWPCSTGASGTPTQPGSYTIQDKMDRGYGGAWDVWLPEWLGLYWAGGTEDGIHGIPYGVNNPSLRLWEGYVGTPVTYGCVMLDDANAKQLYSLAYVGMPVIIQP
jgi:lysozyme